MECVLLLLGGILLETVASNIDISNAPNHKKLDHGAMCVLYVYQFYLTRPTSSSEYTVTNYPLKFCPSKTHLR
jgi:hypothetical protein